MLFGLTMAGCHAGRFLLYNVPDLRDHRKFPARSVAHAGVPFRFSQPTHPVRLRLPPEITKRRHRSLETFLRSSGTVAFLLIRHDTLLYEYYRPGFDTAAIVPSFSVAKGFVSALVGIAIGEGYIRSIHDPITHYLPELDTARFRGVTIEHLLQMRAGLSYSENYFNPFGDVAKFYYGRHLNRYVRHLHRRLPPDSVYAYQSGNTQLLGMLVARASGRPLAQYLQEKLWQPMGMEFDASWSLDSRAGNTEKAFCCLNARARDFAKLGRLYLRRGEWQGRQLVPRQWVEQSVYDTLTQTPNKYRYSYHWRHVVDYRRPNPGAPKPPDKRGVPHPGPDFFAEGILGQFVYVYPSKDFIMVRLGKRAGFTHWPKLGQQLARLN